MGQALGAQVPAASAFTAFGNAGLSFNDNNGTIDLSSAGNGSTALRGATVSLSSSTAYVSGVLTNTEKNSVVSACNIVMRESSTGKAVGATMVAAPGAGGERSYIYSSTYNSSQRLTIDQTIVPTFNAPTILRIHRSGSNVIVSYSSDNRTWTVLYTYSTSAAFTSAPDQIGFATEAYSNTSSRLLSLQYGSL